MSSILLVASHTDSLFTLNITLDFLIKLLAAVGVAGLIAVLKWCWPHIRAHISAVSRLRRAERALDDHSPGLWLAPSIPIERPKQTPRCIPIVVVANLKGGVGKTTTVANLIGHYGLMKNKRVLAIDLDFQGSLSAIIMTEDNYRVALQRQEDGTPSKAAQLVSGKDGQWIRDTADPVAGVSKARCIPSYYTLSIAENRVMVEWLIAKRTEDVRFSLAKALHDPAIQESFDMILIDAPPRLTTGCVQALCAATHVLIPTVLDGLSGEAVGGFVEQLATNQKLWPQLKLLGVFANMTNKLMVDADGRSDDAALADYEADARQQAIDAVQEALMNAALPLRSIEISPMLPLECFIPQKAELGRQAGERIGYRVTSGSVATQQISRAFDRLGDEIDRRILATTKG